jgi:predicted TIM-barrel fold metal-dependent hydrolase
MYRERKVIDVHGHLSSPPAVRAFAFNLTAFRNPGDRLTLADEDVRPAMERHLRMLDARRIDLQLLSARPVAMMHWEHPRLVASWTRTMNDLIAQQCRLHPERFAGVAQLPQSVAEDTGNCVDELERCIHELGFVAATVNPDPGADRRAPGMDSSYWYPLYAKAEELDATLVVHPSLTHDPRLASVPSAYQYNNLTEEALATLLLENSDVFERFPRLRVVVCHCGGALRRLLHQGDALDAVAHARGEDNVVRESGETAGGQVGMPVQSQKSVRRDLSMNLFFDTCAYDPHFLAAALRQRGVNRMLFGTEVPGSGSDLRNPATGQPADDVLATLESLGFLADEELLALVHGNPRRVFPLLARRYPELHAT